jgi:hypothetical protein
VKLAVAAIGGLLLAAGATAWLWRSAEPAPVTQHVQTAAAKTAPAEPMPPTDGRLFLSSEQQTLAIASGTLDRPVKSLLSVKGPLKFGDFQWNDQGVPAGPTWIRVDLGSQLISVFRAGHEVGTAVIVYGGENKETPKGTLRILGKAREHRSSLYDAEMPYTLRLTGDGVSIHGSSVRWGAATHGCIGVPLEFARRLFDAAKVGDEVVIVAPHSGPGPIA